MSKAFLDAFIKSAGGKKASSIEALNIINLQYARYLEKDSLNDGQIDFLNYVESPFYYRGIPLIINSGFANMKKDELCDDLDYVLKFFGVKRMVTGHTPIEKAKTAVYSK